MKKFLTIFALLFATALSASARPSRTVEASEIRMTRSGDQVTVSFTLSAERKATKADYNLVVNPVLLGGATQRRLPSIVIQGRRSKVTDMRHEMATGERRYELPPVYATPGTTVDYTYTLPYENWMRGGQLVFEGVSVGCCSSTEIDLGIVADNILYSEPVMETRIVETPVVMPARTTGEQLAEQYTFIAPVTELAEASRRDDDYVDYNMRLRGVQGAAAPGEVVEQQIVEASREGSISIYFRQGSRTIDRNLSDNNRNLVELISAVRALSQSSDARIVKVVIAGFASPEGSVGLNNRLASDRAEAVTSFLTANSDIDPRTIAVYNGGVDWQGLRQLVAQSHLARKWQVIDIIDNTPIWDYYHKVGRLGELMRVDGGNTYRYMAREFFPELRQAAYIKVYFDNK